MEDKYESFSGVVENCASCLHGTEWKDGGIECEYNYDDPDPEGWCGRYKKDINKTNEKVFDIIELYKQKQHH